MTSLRAPLTVLLFWASLVATLGAPQEKSPFQQNTPPYIQVFAQSNASWSSNAAVGTLSNGAVVKFFLSTDATSNAVLMGDTISFNTNSGDVFADGNARFQQYDQTWIGPHLVFNIKTREIKGADFRTGRAPFFASASGLHGDFSNHVYRATNGLMTFDDYDIPLESVTAGNITIAPGDYFSARNAVFWIGSVPVFYLPYWYQDLSKSPNQFNFMPGYRGNFGPFLLSTYEWQLNSNFDGAIHADWREKRGFGAGPDVNFHLGEFGEGTAKYYYTKDNDPGVDPFSGVPLPHDRQRAYFSYLAGPWTNLTLRSQVSWQTDPLIVRDFFESEYIRNVQPNTFVEANQLWRNWSLDVIAQPRVNDFYETVERLPEVRMTGFRQQVFGLPIYYESETTAGYYTRKFSNTNAFTPDYAAARADTFHQLTMPETFFGWLNVTPRAGVRGSYYDDASGPGATTTEQTRGVFNTGVEFATKASKVWTTSKNEFWDTDGLRHIFEPAINYVYIPRPSAVPNELPQFDYELTNSLRLLPLDFPDYNAIDAIDSQNTIRLGMANRLQTKRKGELDTLLYWSVFSDWRIDPRTNQTHWSDLSSDFELKPRSWLTFDSETRFDLGHSRLNLSLSRVTIRPGNRWSWGVGYFYLRDGIQFGPGNDLLTSTFFYRLNENWGARMQHWFDTRTGTLQEQDYTIYRDLRSWTAALTFRVLDSTANGTEFGVTFTFSLKAFPRFGLGRDSVNAASLLGY